MKSFLFLFLLSPSLLAWDTWFAWVANPPEELVSSYNIYERFDTNYSLIAIVGLTNFVYLTNVSSGVHFYSITAVNADGESDFSSDFVSEIPFSAQSPTNITVTLTP